MRAFRPTSVLALGALALAGCQARQPAFAPLASANTNAAGALFTQQADFQAQRPVVSPAFGQPTTPPKGRLSKMFMNNPVTSRLARALGLPDAAVPPSGDPLLLSRQPTVTHQLHVSLGQIAERQGALDKARQHFQQALQLQPGNVDALLVYAHLEDRQGRLAEAAKLYETAVAANPTHAGAHNDLGLCYARQGELNRSVNMLQRAIQLGPGDRRYRNNLARVHVELDRVDDAIVCLAPSLGLPNAHYNVAVMLNERGKTNDAIAHFSQALMLNPQMAEADAWLAKLRPSEKVADVAATRPQTPRVKVNRANTAARFTPVATVPTVSRPAAATPVLPQSRSPSVAPKLPVVVGPTNPSSTAARPAAPNPTITTPPATPITSTPAPLATPHTQTPPVPLYPAQPVPYPSSHQSPVVLGDQPAPSMPSTGLPPQTAPYAESVPPIENQFGNQDMMQAPPVPQPITPWPPTPAFNSAPYPSTGRESYPGFSKAVRRSPAYPPLQMPAQLLQTDLSSHGKKPPTPVVLTNVHALPQNHVDQGVQPASAVQ